MATSVTPNDIKEELKKLTKQDLQDAAAKITPQQIEKVPPEHIKAAIEAISEEQLTAILQTLKKNQGQLGPMVAQLTEDQLTHAVGCVKPGQKEIAIKEFDLNNQNSPLASIVNQNISEKKREVIKSNAPKGDGVKDERQ
eukprot:TRINITY_DN567_c0_g2_i1.p4 TRINITY_DN567_c0_g2~~TRINITY_DN567_c0_g2_i1.p4  ORF type:complete len:140 (+),score=90.72 TRINITY_DN567_c0_g2_i1:59-478(+)